MLLLYQTDPSDTSATKENGFSFNSEEGEHWFMATNPSRKVVVDSAVNYTIRYDGVDEEALRQSELQGGFYSHKHAATQRLLGQINVVKGTNYSKAPWAKWDDFLYRNRIVIEGFLPADEFDTPMNNWGNKHWRGSEWSILLKEYHVCEGQEVRIKVRKWTDGKCFASSNVAHIY